MELHNNELLMKLEEKNNEIVNKNTFLLNKLSKIVVMYEQANRLNSKFCKSIPVLNAKSYRVLEILRDSENVERSISQKIIINSINEFEAGLFDSYKSYTINFLDYLTQTEELYFSSKNINVQISSIIKLFDNPYFSINNDRSKIKVYTAFRDKIAYDQKQREVGEQPYTIDGNSDFAYCLNNDYFIKNNAKNGVDGYKNEHSGFEGIYNSTIVTALKTKLPDDTYKCFGFLCCDYLDEQNALELFDITSARILLSFAQQYTTYLETLDSNWTDRVVEGSGFPTNFLQVIYKRTYKGK